MSDRLVWNIREKKLPASLGSKAENLRQLIRLGFTVPQTYVISWSAYQRYLQNDKTVIDALRRELSEVLNPNKRYAVRSSANIEDQLADSFAGQFKSVLDVSEIDAILQAVWSIWATAQSPRIQEYIAHKGGVGLELCMAVIVQEMVAAQVSGVVFSKNPLNGMNEVIIEAVPGSGEALVQDGATPLRWVYRWNDWVEKAPNSPLPEKLLHKLVRQTRQIAARMKKNVDLEWVYDGADLVWVQVREITSLKDLNIYSNRIARDMLPGVIKPLIWSINIPLVNQVWIQILTELIGANDMRPEDLAKAFFYRTYFNMGKFGQIFASLGLPPETLEMMFGLLPAEHKRPPMRITPGVLVNLPRLVRFVVDKARFARKVEAFLPQCWTLARTFPLEVKPDMDDLALLERIDQVHQLAQEIAYYNIIVPLAMNLYNAILRRQLKSVNISYDELDLMRGMTAIQDYDPGFHLRKLNRIFRVLDPELQARLKTSDLVALQRLAQEDAGVAELLAGFQDLLVRFGHLSDSGNDFSSVPWRERPQSILQMVWELPESPEIGAAKLGFESLRIPFWKRWMLGKIYQRARQYRLYREQISSLYTYVYGLFRVYYLALAERLVQRGQIAQPDDIFYLHADEVRCLIQGGRLETPAAELAAQRRQEMEQFRNIVPPETIFGDQPPPIIRTEDTRLVGIPASRGYYTGSVTVVKGLSDFGKIKDGAILVIPYSDVGWTPLFAKAGAVISESGGLLAHASIIAREYGIPAVVSVSNATQLLDGRQVTVDGFRGEVILHS